MRRGLTFLSGAGLGANGRWAIPRESRGDKPENLASWRAVNYCAFPRILNSIVDTALLLSLGSFVTNFTQTITRGFAEKSPWK